MSEHSFVVGQRLRCVDPGVALQQGAIYIVESTTESGVYVRTTDGKRRHRYAHRFVPADDTGAGHVTDLLNAFCR